MSELHQRYPRLIQLHQRFALKSLQKPLSRGKLRVWGRIKRAIERIENAWGIG